MMEEKNLPGSTQNLLWLFLGSLALITPLMAFAYYLSPSSGFILYTKEVLVVLAVPVFFILSKGRGIQSFLWPLLPLIAYLGVSFIFSEATLKANLAATRQLLYPFIFLFIGFAVAPRIKQKLINRQLIRFTLVLIGLGTVMLLVGQSNYAWVAPYFNAKGIIPAPSGFPSQWVEPGFGHLPRMASTLFDPVNFGHFLVFALFGVIVNKGTHKSIPIVIIVVLAILATMCKGAWLQSLVVFGMCFFPIHINQKFKIAALLAIPIVVIIIAQYHLGAKLHLIGISTALETITVFGYGLGETGNVAVMFGTTSFPAIYDTYIGGLIGQLGIAGLLIWLFPIVVFLYKIRKVDYVLLWVIIAQLIVAVYSENAMNPLSVAFPFTWFGLALYRSGLIPEMQNEG